MKIQSARIMNAKRLLAIFMSCLIFIGLMPPASFAEDEYLYNEYTYIINESDSITITDVDESIAGEITVPDTIDGHAVTVIGNFAFEDCVDLTGVTLPESVAVIGDFAFSCCYALAEINIPDGVVSIGEMAFGSCFALKNIELPNSLTNIGDGAFYNCGSLEELNIPRNVTEIGAYMCGACVNLKAVSVDDENTYFSAHDGILFNNDKTELLCYPCGKEETTYTIPDGVALIGDGAFDSNTVLTEVILPGSLKIIGHDAFYACSSLTEMDFPYGVTDISYQAFFNCTALETVYFTESIVSIDFWAFIGCKAITDVYYKCNEDSWDALLAVAMENGGNTALRDADIHFSHAIVRVPLKTATCLEYGNSEYFACSNCDIWFEDMDATTRITDKDSVLLYAKGHRLTLVPANDATCLNDGNKEYYTCSNCRNWFEDKAGKVEITDKDSVIIPATGHSLTLVPEKGATCLDAGNTAYYVCSNCGQWFEDEACTAEIVDKDSVIIPATGHSLTLVPENDATCSDDGNTSYYVCSNCGQLFEDKAGTAEITDKGSVVIPAKGHTPGDAAHENEVPVSCDKDGSYDEVVYCKECGAELSRETKTVYASGHDWGEWEVTKAPSETENGEETRTCKNDPSHTETRQIPKLDNDNGDDGNDDNPLLMGDINDNGQIDAGDATMALRSTVGMIKLDSKQATVGDVNKNGVVDAGDATMILRHIVGLITIE